MSKTDLKTSTYNIEKAARKFKRHMPSKEHSNIDWDKICDAAADHGVVIYPDGSFIALHRKPTKSFLTEIIKGPYKSIKIPTEGFTDQCQGKTTIVLCRDTALKTTKNPTASYLTLTEMYGVCIWLPKENVV